MLINEKNEATTQKSAKSSESAKELLGRKSIKMTEKNYEAVYSASLSREMEADRYIVIDNESGEILDTASGWGYDSKDNAYRAFEYKLRHGEKTCDQLQQTKRLRAKSMRLLESSAQ